MKLDNTTNLFTKMVNEYGGDEPDRFARQLRAFAARVEMDIRNAFSSTMVDVQMAIANLPEDAAEQAADEGTAGGQRYGGGVRGR